MNFWRSALLIVLAGLGAIIGVVQYFAFGTPFTVWAMVSAFCAGWVTSYGFATGIYKREEQ